MKKVFSIRTKAEVIIISFILIGISALSVMSVTRTITDSSDTIYTRITNSNGGVWEATGANIQVAIDSVNGSTDGGGTVWLPKKNYTITDPIFIPENVTLDCNWATIIPDDDYDVIRMFPRSSLHEVIIDISSVGAYSDTNACIRFYTPVSHNPYSEGFDYPRNRLVRDVSLISSGQRGIGILLNPRDISPLNSFAYNNVQNVKGKFLNCTLKLVNDDPNNYVNFNDFENILGVGCNYHVWLRCTVSEIAGNNFVHIKYEAEPAPDEHYPIYMQGNCVNNMFSEYQVMDWIAEGEYVEEIYLERYTPYEPGGNRFEGTSMTFSKVYDASISDAGYSSNNTYYGNYEFRIRNFSVSNTAASGHGINPGLDSDNGISFYKNTQENPWTFFYGDVADNDKYGAFRIDSAGNLDFATESGAISLEPSDKIVYIKDMLDLTVTTSAPATSDGRIAYADGSGWNPGSGEGFYGFYDGAWNVLNPISNSGECRIASGSDNVVVSHNMSAAPTMVLVTPFTNLSSESITLWYVDTVTATQFTLHVNEQTDSVAYFYWNAEYR